jgi:hypothetical protein
LWPRVYVAVADGIITIHQQLPKALLVFASVAVDPVTLGWAESYSRPGGMITVNVQNALGE